MRRCLLLALAAVAALVPAAPADDPPAGFTPLFNGKDLTGWTFLNAKNKEVWGAENGVLYCSGGGGGWLMTEKDYADFELQFQYKLPKMGNSGVALRAPMMGDPAYQGIELQLIDEANWKGLRPVQLTGSIYDVVGPSKDATKPFGEWNRMHVMAKGRHVTVELNGTATIEADLDKYEGHFQKHPGLTRKDGRLGFQSYNFRVEFKDIFVKPL
jgi:hypothetical protein